MLNGVRQLDKYDESLPLLHRDVVPRDRFWGTYWILYFFGIVSLLPWYVFPIVEQYFRFQLYQYPYFADHIVNYVAIASQVPAAIVLFANTYIIERVSERIRITLSLVVIFLMFFMSMVLALLDSDEWQLLFFILTISSIVIINTASCVFQGGVFALAARFPIAYRQSVTSGQGFGGFIAASSNILSLLAAGGPSHLTRAELSQGAVGYFITAQVVTIITGIGYCVLGRLEFAAYFPTCVMKRNIRKRHWSTFFRETFRILKQMGHMALSTFLVFLVSLSIYPALGAKIHSVRELPGMCDVNDTLSNVSTHHSNTPDRLTDPGGNASGSSDISATSEAWICTYFQPVTCFLLFNFTSFIGRTLPGRVRFPSHRYLLVPIVARSSLLGLYVFCKYSVDHKPYFNSDVAPILLMTAVGVTNGYCNSLAFMYAPELVKKEDAETAGAIMAASEGLSSLFGVLVSFGLTDLYIGSVQAHLPLIHPARP